MPLVKRSDDNEESFKKRYNTYKVETEPVIKFLEDLGILIRLDGNGEIEETFKELEKVLGLGE
jgi:adenylate kinase